jgi:hypothetical protein
MDCVEHLWLVVRSRPSAGGQRQLTEEQMHVSVESYERVAATTTTGMISKEVADNGCGWEVCDAGYCAET